MPQIITAEKYTSNVRRRATSAFTLIELIIVIALTGLLLTLILGPLVQGFNLTNRARALAEAQDATRFGIEQLKRELSQAAYVFDNSLTPVTLPFSASVNDQRASAYPNVYSTQPGNPTPSVLFAKIDFIPTATAGEGADTAIDPTTDKPLGGSPLVLPVAPGRRYVRYFIGLREPYRRNPDGSYAGPNYYTNQFEFRRTDSAMNPFILWRAEYNPNDPKLINQGVNPYEINGGGLHDPNFFYNPNPASNGRTYAENWRAVSQPVLSAPNLDLIAWRKNQAKELVAGSPFQILLNFTPTTVAGETATPGYLSGAFGGQAAAVPNLYSTQFGHWTYPFTVTVYRGSSQNRPGQANFGQVQFRVEQIPSANLSNLLRVTMSQMSGDSIVPVSGNYYWLFDRTAGTIFIYTSKLALRVDPSRGSVETAFPPLATQQATNEAIPLYVPEGTNSVTPLVAGPDGNYGTLVPTVFRQGTRRTNAGLSGVPTNAGLQFTSLSQPLYYLVQSPLPIYTLPASAGYASPFSAFMGQTTWQGIMITPSSEKVQGPDVNVSFDPTTGRLLLADYSRLPNVGEVSLAKKAGVSNGRFVRSIAPNYQLETALGNYNNPVLKFDETTSGESGSEAIEAEIPGLPAITPGEIDPATNQRKPEGELRVTYLWQNNYARDAAGRALNTYGEIVTSADRTPAGGGVGSRHTFITGADYRPEPDVMKIDYSTRSQINVQLGARVYDTSTGQPQTAQINNRITVGNIAR
ncbi:MAG: hypothetical protein SFU56_15245 [Capsulimonadales bacterium]|nr:hypothetical protein [Capsulimonadales bacterium]